MTKPIKITSIIFLSLAGVIILLWAITPNTYVVERSILISASKEKVMEQISDFENMNKWSPWADYNPNMELKVIGVPSTVGHKSVWSGNDKVGVGSQEIIQINEESLRTQLIFTSPWESQSQAYYQLVDKSDGTVVTWGLEGSMPFPMNVLMDMDAQIGADYEKGLLKLKAVCEKPSN